MSIRFRSGVVQLVRCPVDSNVVIEPGDLVYLDAGHAKPASDFPWTTDLATTRAAFAAVFAGVAHTGSAEGETEPISVDLSPMAVYEQAAVASAYAVGDVLAPAETVSALDSQTLELVTDVGHAIARAVETADVVASSIRVCFASAIHAGSANVNAALG